MSVVFLGLRKRITYTLILSSQPQQASEPRLEEGKPGNPDDVARHSHGDPALHLHPPSHRLVAGLKQQLDLSPAHHPHLVFAHCRARGD